jgi:hypothetical protein
MARTERATAKHASDTVNRPRKRFQYLRPRTRQIPQNVITRQWKLMSDSTSHQIREIFRMAKRPIIMAQRNEIKRKEVDEILRGLVHKLEKRCPRIPFPPKTKDMHFDLDKLLEENVRLPSRPVRTFGII